jgi:hypothetical protein
MKHAELALTVVPQRNKYRLYEYIVIPEPTEEQAPDATQRQVLCGNSALLYPM